MARGVQLLPQDCDNGDGTATIPLFDRYGEKIAETIIDAEDLERVLQLGYWHIHNRNTKKRLYASCGAVVEGKRIEVRLHRFIMDCPKGLEVDHINRNGLDNLKGNLRITTTAQNLQNQGVRKNSSTGLRGVSRREYKNRVFFTARGSLNLGNGKYQSVYLGSFDTAEEANKVAQEWRLANMTHTIEETLKTFDTTSRINPTIGAQ